MNERRSRSKNFTVQAWLLFGLFLFACLMFYVMVNKASNNKIGQPKSNKQNSFAQGVSGDRSAVNSVVVNGETVDGNGVTKATNPHVPQLTAEQFSSVIAKTVSKSTQSSVSSLHLPDKRKMRANQWFQTGLKAYLSGENRQAYENWIKAAEFNHAKAYFNLGLMASDQSIAQQLNGLKDADYYFEKARKNNYLPAIKNNGQSFVDQTVANIPVTAASTKLVDNSFELTEKSTVKPSQKLNDASTRILNKVTNAQVGLGRESWISNQSDNGWTIQVRAFKEKNELDAFLNEYEFGANAAVFREHSGDDILYKLVIGAFDSRDAADKARSFLPNDVKVGGPWLRRFKDIKRAMIGS